MAEVERRATTTLKWATDAGVDLLSVALDHLTLARVGLLRAILERGSGILPPGSGTGNTHHSDSLEA